MREYNTELAIRIYNFFNDCIISHLVDNWWCPYCLSYKVVQVCHILKDKFGNQLRGEYWEDFDYWYCECCHNDWEDYVDLSLDFKELYTKHKKLDRKV